VNFSGADLVPMIGRVSTEGVTVAIGDDMLIAIGVGVGVESVVDVGGRASWEGL